MYSIQVSNLEKLSSGVEHIVEISNQAAELADVANTRDPACVLCVWRSFWDKPLFSNTKVEIAHRNRKELLESYSELEAKSGICYLADPKNQILVNVGNWRSSSTYDLPAGHPWGSLGLNVPLWRLKAIENIARVLISGGLVREQVEKVFSIIPEVSIDSDEEFCHLEELCFEVIKSLRDAMGRGIGHITVAHALTDLGVFVKPDIWLCRTLEKLGFPGLRTLRAQPTLRETAKIGATMIAFSRCRALSDLFRETYPELQFSDRESRWKLRFLDLFLMRMRRPYSASSSETPPSLCSDHDFDWICS